MKIYPFILIIVGIFFGVLILLIINYSQNKQITSDLIETNEEILPSNSPVIQPHDNFEETGTLVNFDSATETETDYWSFVYEKPGSPALKMKLEFTDKSVCVISETETPCDKAKLNNGDRVKVEGIKTDSDVTVHKLQTVKGNVER
ncbi:MAG: hypothetical protein ACOX6V_01230 [Patescibacteria group bacterium]|jgi:hypothetical protein